MVKVVVDGCVGRGSEAIGLHACPFVLSCSSAPAGSHPLNTWPLSYAALGFLRLASLQPAPPRRTRIRCRACCWAAWCSSRACTHSRSWPGAWWTGARLCSECPRQSPGVLACMALRMWCAQGLGEGRCCSCACLGGSCTRISASSPAKSARYHGCLPPAS